MLYSNVFISIRKSLILVILFYFNAYSQNTGTIQVVCEPNAKIFLDGIYKGTTDNLYNGIILQDISIGIHKIKAVKEGFVPQEKQITLVKDQVLLFTVQPFTPSINIQQEGDENQGEIKRKVGRLIIQSIPISCKINIPGLGLSNVLKSKDKWTASNVPIGKYNSSFTSHSTTLKYNFEIIENKTIHLMVNFLDKTVIEKGQVKGKLKINSNKAGVGFSINDLKRDTNFYSETPLIKYMYPSEYRLEWNDNFKDRSIFFRIYENKKTTIYIPFYKPLMKYKTVEDHPDFLNENFYINSKFNPLPETEIYEKRTMDWGTFFLLSSAGCFPILYGLMADDGNISRINVSLAIGFTIAGIFIGIDSKKATRHLESNVMKNIKKRDELKNEYFDKYNKWEMDIDKKNQLIKKRNQDIKRYNNSLPKPSVSYR